MPDMITTIGFDADDTLWQNEQFYRLTEARFAELLKDHADTESLPARLLAAEKRNLGLYGFGIKGFVLSMVETAVDVTDGRVPSSVIAEILAAGREMLVHPVEPLPHVKETLETLHGTFRLVMITKGDLFDQERKLAASGLGDYFNAVEIVSDKTAATYDRIFTRQGDGPAKSLMVGNSLKSDIVPALEAGSWGIYVPHALTWAFEHHDKPDSHPRFREIADLGGLSDALQTLPDDSAARLNKTR
ncbi:MULTISPECIES: HAD family hydrolase [unclassified Ensifer]|uniref:HAD family hydrolase n=1 Tax=unclassified Ensifer TaxID=2633371 RepID=UPI00070D0251|nr:MULTISPECIES: HAD family hydrolase [unclassified Ensifer]KQW60770.1 HAD family hydrolase [Ensifer sp. Root1252]KRC57452.1 HAD family hydrolase [Ensifer sp. Root231]KRD00100.1 HAD family hydrolase [Ensifer sp. Root258]